QHVQRAGRRGRRPHARGPRRAGPGRGADRSPRARRRPRPARGLGRGRRRRIRRRRGPRPERDRRAALPAHRAVPGQPRGGDRAPRWGVRAPRWGERARGRGERARRRGAVPGVSGGPSAGTLRRDAALTAVLAAIGVLAVWWVFVTTALGQQVESTALEGSRI